MKTTSNYHGFQLQIHRYGQQTTELYKDGKIYKSRPMAEKQISKIIEKDHELIPDNAPYTPEVWQGRINEIRITEWFDE